MKYYYPILALTLLGCGVSSNQGLADDYKRVVGNIYNDPRGATSSDPRLLPYVQKFSVDFKTPIVDLPVYLGDIDTAGKCLKWVQNYGPLPRVEVREVIISGTYYEKIKETPSRVEQLVYHELGHCVLNLTHNDHHTEDGMPLSVMRSWAFNTQEITEYYKPYKEYYLTEMRKGDL